MIHYTTVRVDELFCTLGMTRALATLVGVWAVGAEVDFAVSSGIELAVVIVLTTIAHLPRQQHSSY